MAQGLTEKQQRFVDEYLIDLNATQAAIRAGYSVRTAKSQGQRMLTFVDVLNAIQLKIVARSEKVGVDAEWVLTESVALYKIARDAIGDEPAAKMVSAAKGALELVGRHVDVQAFKDKLDVVVTDRAAVIERARHRRLSARD